jgi:hypothetical protein
VSTSRKWEKQEHLFPTKECNCFLGSDEEGEARQKEDLRREGGCKSSASDECRLMALDAYPKYGSVSPTVTVQGSEATYIAES